MRLADAAEPTFARHETFHPRYGWFRKAYAFVANDPGIFTRADAPVRIGVGKNMVRAIRFWGLAAKLIERDAESATRRGPDFTPTSLGHGLFGEAGWDRYMEDPGTLWLLHWLLLAPRCMLPVWWLAFNEFDAVEFTYDDLEVAITLQLQVATNWAPPHPTSIRKDVSALLRTYAPAEQSGRMGIDDVLDCPLRELNLIGRSAATDRYRFVTGPKPTLPSAILAYAALDYLARTDTGGNTATVSRLAHESGAPGKVFKLTEAELLAALEPAVEGSDMLVLAATPGSTQISWSAEPGGIANEILDRYYRNFISSVPDDREGAPLMATASVRKRG